ncbi:MAG: hypothetical protein MK135_04725 [Polyangiaceae bacterium]|nr:hypothetical protein [Polyangiaceae bacterium]
MRSCHTMTALFFVLLATGCDKSALGAKVWMSQDNERQSKHLCPTDEDTEEAKKDEEKREKKREKEQKRREKNGEPPLPEEERDPCEPRLVDGSIE